VRSPHLVSCKAQQLDKTSLAICGLGGPPFHAGNHRPWPTCHLPSEPSRSIYIHCVARRVIPCLGGELSIPAAELKNPFTL